jgi:ribonuclease P protein component
MKKTISLKLNRDFKRLYYRGKSVACGYVIVYMSKNRSAGNRLGLTCGKSVGKAVVRNRVKRLIRESYRLSEGRLKTGYDIVIVARSRAAGKPFDAIYKDVRYAFNKLELIEKDEKTVTLSD